MGNQAPKPRSGTGNDGLHEDGMTHQAIADVFGVSREAIRQTEERALKKLRKNAEKMGMRSFLEWLNEREDKVAMRDSAYEVRTERSGSGGE